jgi:hypothetical protein
MPKKQSTQLRRFKMVQCPPEANQWKYCYVSMNHFEIGHGNQVTKGPQKETLLPMKSWRGHLVYTELTR